MHCGGTDEHLEGLSVHEIKYISLRNKILQESLLVEVKNIY